MKVIIVWYENFVFLYKHGNKLGTAITNQIEYLEYFEGTKKEFMVRYQKDYPTSSKQIFCDSKHPLRFHIRQAIETSSEFKIVERSRKLKNILR